MTHDEHRLKPKQPRNVWRDAYELLGESGSERPPATPPACIPFPRFAVLAADPASEERQETFHLRHCRVCRDRLQKVRSERAASNTPEQMRLDVIPGALPMGMCEGIAPEALVGTVFTAINNAVDGEGDRMKWSLEGAFALLNYLKKCAIDAAAMDRSASRRQAARYAEIVVKSPDAIKVVLVYGLIVFKDARPFAIDAAREIADRDDRLAHEVLVYTLCTDAVHLIKGIDSGRWREIASAASPALESYRACVDDAVQRFMSAIQPPHTLAEAEESLRQSAEAMADAMIAGQNEGETILRLLALRHYLGSVAAYAHETYSDVAAAFPRITALLHSRARHHGALTLAMEACEKLRLRQPLETVIETLTAYQPPDVELPEEREEEEVGA
jgi:hypothetical protein